METALENPRVFAACDEFHLSSTGSWDFWKIFYVVTYLYGILGFFGKNFLWCNLSFTESEFEKKDMVF